LFLPQIVFAVGPPSMSDFEARQMALAERFRLKGLVAQREASEKFRVGQTQATLEVLQDHLDDLANSRLDAALLARLRRPVEMRLSHFRLLAAQQELEANKSVPQVDKTEKEKEEKLERLAREFNRLFKEGKYAEAESVAMKALELDPDSPVAGSYLAPVQRRTIEPQEPREQPNTTEEGDDSASNQNTTTDADRWIRAGNFTVTYDVCDLIRIMTEEKLIRSVTNTIMPKTWSALGGEGTITADPSVRGLAITQAVDVHEQIDSVLDALRRLHGIDRPKRDPDGPAIRP
jgi:hypothetical protein